MGSITRRIDDMIEEHGSLKAYEKFLEEGKRHVVSKEYYFIYGKISLEEEIVKADLYKVGESTPVLSIRVSPRLRSADLNHQQVLTYFEEKLIEWALEDI